MDPVSLSRDGQAAHALRGKRNMASKTSRIDACFNCQTKRHMIHAHRQHWTIRGVQWHRKARPPFPSLGSNRLPVSDQLPHRSALHTFRSHRPLHEALVRGVGESRSGDSIIDRLPVEQGGGAGQEDVVKPEVPGRRKGFSERDKSAERPGDSATNAVPLRSAMRDAEYASDKARLTQLWNSSTVSEAAMSDAPSRGAIVRIIFQYAGRWFDMTLSWALK